jgi:hypothetical protein
MGLEIGMEAVISGRGSLDKIKVAIKIRSTLISAYICVPY